VQHRLEVKDVMAAVDTALPPRQRNLILGALLLLAAGAWAVLIRQAAMGDAMATGAGGPAMGMAAPLFLAIWVLMMAAMMFPTAAPMILMFAAIAAGKRQRGQPFAPTWLFVSAYLLVWSLVGIVAYTLALGAERVAAAAPWFIEHGAQAGGAVLILAGIYQLSPLKQVCLVKCRSPLQFVLSSWRDGRGGAFRMGLTHGVYCLGCCWLLFLILFPLGVMNIAVMAALTALIFAEKSLPAGRRIGQVAAGALITYGVVVLFLPSALPTVM
jgi:predicted metal-binding membrane protein